MSWPAILVYYLLAAVLTFHLVSATRGPETAVTPAAATAPFLEAVPERIDRVRMENESLAIQFEKRDGRWITTEPEGLAPPGDVIDAVLESLTSLPAIDIVADGSGREGEFGLVPPRMRIRIEQQGALVSMIALGELSPTRTAVYARKSGSDEVALIGLNAKYYIDLVFENVRRQRGSAGASPPAAERPSPPAGALAPMGGTPQDAP
ncbi:MAG: DUF4340 domain-containing protein, partial [Candidatus Binatia bacterium]